MLGLEMLTAMLTIRWLWLKFYFILLEGRGKDELTFRSTSVIWNLLTAPYLE